MSNLVNKSGLIKIHSLKLKKHKTKEYFDSESNNKAIG